MTGDTFGFHRKLDVRGLHCPVPVIKCRATLDLMEYGEVLYLVGSDRDLLWEIRRLAARLGHDLALLSHSAGECHLMLRKRTFARRPGHWRRERGGLAHWLASWGRGPSLAW